MAKDCDNLSPSPDLQATAITPGALLSPSLSKTKTRSRPLLGFQHSITSISSSQSVFFFSRKYWRNACLKSTADTGDPFENTV
jgi:hypothetical protein